MYHSYAPQEGAEGKIKMPSESHCHDSSHFLLGLLGSTIIVVVEAIEDSETDDPQTGK